MLQKDNSTIRQKIALRKAALKFVSGQPVVLESHAGAGAIWKKCYGDVTRGVAMEKDGHKASILAMQRPTWSVYMCECVAALGAGVGSHLPVNFLDLDPYGEPWPVLDAFLSGHKPTVSTLVIAINDGLRHRLKRGGGNTVGSMATVVPKFGSRLNSRYLQVCEYLMNEKATAAGYRLARFTGYYAGALDAMTHYASVWTRINS